MKPLFKFAVSLAALGGLLAGASSHATNVATLPLKASVLAKPNVIFGVDDSGSMDAELLLPTNDGAFWWDSNSATWNGALHYNDAGNANDQWRKFIYLFPNGTGTGDRVYNDGADAHFAVMPIDRFAFLRSPDYNKLYYDSKETYKPWSPAQAAGSPYGNASTTAAKSNPVYGTGTFNVRDNRAASTTDNWVFTALRGMVVPDTAGTQYRNCDDNNANCGAWTAVPAGGITVPDNRVFRVAMAYFPATFWVKEACTVGAGCTNLTPDGATIKRYEIKAGNTFPSGRSYADELQNFANWFTYYRKRKQMLNAAMGQVLEPLTGLRMGMIRFNSLPGATTRITMYDLDSPNPANNGLKVAGLFYETNGSGGTPTRETLKRIGDEFANAAGPIQYACQRNNAFIVTDGFANVSNVNPPAYSKATWGTGVPYETTYDNTLANLALGFYTINPRPAMATGKVAKTAVDENTDLHINTYGMTIGSRGVLYVDQNTAPPTDPAAWVNPTQARHPASVDDLWHATINGRGKMYLADTPTETAAKIQAAMTDILSATGAQGGIAVSTINLGRGDKTAYFGTYNPAGWAGDLTANPVDPLTGVVDSSNAKWKAAGLLAARDWTTRVIATASGGSGVGFTAANVASTVNPGGVYGTDAEVIDYLRGDRTHEGTKFRTRTSLMGAVINSEPAVSRDEGVVYVQSGEGMLHAFDTKAPDAGKELWAFVPSSVLPKIGATAERGYVFDTLLDGTPVIGKSGATSKLLVAGLGAAGNSFYALDVTNPRGLTEADLAGKFKWSFPSAALQSKVGLAVGRPLIVNTVADGYVVLVTSGYNSTADGKGRLWMLNPADGSVIHEFETADGTLASESGLAQVAGYLENDGTVRFVYAGDLLGNVWRFDLKDKTAPFKLAVLKNAANQTQPVTAAPELIEIAGKRVVIVGTGRLLDITDFGSTSIQSIYAISDGAFLATPRTTLVKQTYTRSTDTITDNPVDWTTDRGWFMDLTAGEQINTRPTIAYGAVAFVSNVNGGTDCSASSYLYVLDVGTGGKYANSAFTSSLISNTANSSAVTALRTVDGKIVGSGQDTDGKPWDKEIDKGGQIKPAKNAWREIRR